MEKSTKIFTIIKYQKKVLNLFVYQQFWSILFLEQLKVVIVKCFYKNVKKTVKEKKITEYITDDIEISSDDFDREDSDEELSNEKDSDEANFNEGNQL